MFHIGCPLKELSLLARTVALLRRVRPLKWLIAKVRSPRGTEAPLESSAVQRSPLLNSPGERAADEPTSLEERRTPQGGTPASEELTGAKAPASVLSSAPRPLPSSSFGGNASSDSLLPRAAVSPPAFDSERDSERPQLIRRRWAETGIKLWNAEAHGTGRLALRIQGQVELLPPAPGETMPIYDCLEFRMVEQSIVCDGVVVDAPVHRRVLLSDGK